MNFRENVRELENIIKKTLIFNRGTPISKEDVSLTLAEKSPDAPVIQTRVEDGIKLWAKQMLTQKPAEALFDFCVDHVSSLLVREALNQTGGNRSQAAKLLGLSRPTLHAKIEKYNIKIETSATND